MGRPWWTLLNPYYWVVWSLAWLSGRLFRPLNRLHDLLWRVTDVVEVLGGIKPRDWPPVWLVVLLEITPKEQQPLLMWWWWNYGLRAWWGGWTSPPWTPPWRPM